METITQQAILPRESVFESYGRALRCYLPNGVLQIGGEEVRQYSGRDKRSAGLFREFLERVREGGLERVALLVDDDKPNSLRISVQNRASPMHSICFSATVDNSHPELVCYRARWDNHYGRTVKRADTDEKLPPNESKRALNARGRKLINESLGHLSL